MSNQAVSTIPPSTASLRACLLCSLIKSNQQFVRIGCENCESILRLRNSSTRVRDCTSSEFDGVIALMQPRKSWVGKWQRVEKFEKGLYAVRVFGRLPEEVEADLEARGIGFWRRDGSRIGE